MKSTHHPSIVYVALLRSVLIVFFGLCIIHMYTPPKKLGMSMGLNKKVHTIPPSYTFCSPPQVLLFILYG